MSVNRDGLVLLHRVEHRWLSLAFLILGGVVGFAPLILAMKDGERDWYARMSLWAACSFTPFFLAALFYIGRTNALLVQPRERVLVHVLGVYRRVRTRRIPFDDVREIRHVTEILPRTRHRSETQRYCAELELTDGSVIRFEDDEQGPLALEISRTVERPLQRKAGPCVAFEVFRWTGVAIGAIGLIVALLVMCGVFVLRR